VIAFYRPTGSGSNRQFIWSPSKLSTKHFHCRITPRLEIVRAMPDCP